MPESDPLAPLIGFSPQEEEDVVAFLMSLTDNRVRFEKAPFDHPQLFVPDGHPGDQNLLTCIGGVSACDGFREIPAVGAFGRPAAGLGPLGPFLGQEQISLQVGLAESLDSPQPAGTVISFTALPVGGSGTYEFQFLLNGTVVQPYSALSRWTWLGLPAGGYTVEVQARNLGSTAPFEARFEIPYVIGLPPATAVTLSPSPAGPQPGGTLVVFNAAASGPSESFEYRFFLNGSEMQAYSPTAFWAWNTSGFTDGTYEVTVWARTIDSPAAFEAVMDIFYVLATPAQISVTLTANPPLSPQAAGTPVAFTAIGHGGSGTYQYRFWLLNGGVWTVVQPYSLNHIWNWNTTGAARGDSFIQVDVRNAGSVADREAAVSLSYSIIPPAVAADFNGDRKSDILWENGTSGQLYVWLMNGITLVSSGSPGTVNDPTWQIKGKGDFDGDGKADILWQNSTSGQLYVWLMNGTTVVSPGSPTTLSDLTWLIKGVGDFDGNGKADILWQNSTSGQLYVWLMNGTTLVSSGSPATVSDTTWLIK